MNIYRIQWFDEDGQAQAWATSEPEVDAFVASYPEGKLEGLLITEEDIPADRDGLARWLNLNFTRNNG